jgi:hypothetical protein
MDQDKPDLTALGKLGAAPSTLAALWHGGQKPAPQFVSDIAKQAKQMDSSLLRKQLDLLESGRAWFPGGATYSMVAHEIFKQELEARRPQVQGSGLLNMNVK